MSKPFEVAILQVLAWSLIAVADWIGGWCFNAAAITAFVGSGFVIYMKEGRS